MYLAPEDIVRSGPNRYICQEGALKDLPDFIKPFKNPVILSGIKSFEAFLEYSQLPVDEYQVIQYKGYSSKSAITDIASQAHLADVIIGIGGGLLLDTAKGVADLLDKEVILIPSVAGTCAASTPLSVIYSNEGSFEQVDYHKRSSYLTLIDPAFLVNAPVDYLKSGIADTLAKWYEAEAIIRNAKDERSQTLFVQAALQQSVYIRNILLEEAVTAVKNSQEGTITPSFTKIIETVITLAGTVGGFGGKYGRMSGAHAIHNGLSYLEETHIILHGQKVAYGILVQLALEERIEEIKQLLPFYQELGLPIKLADLYITENIAEAKQIVASHAVKPEESLLFIGEYTVEDVIRAMDLLEELK